MPKMRLNKTFKNGGLVSKQCSICKVEKPADNFTKNATKTDKHNSACKECVNKPKDKKTEKQETTNIFQSKRYFRNNSVPPTEVSPAAIQGQAEKTLTAVIPKATSSTSVRIPKPPQEKNSQNADYEEAKTLIFLVEFFTTHLPAKTELYQTLFMCIKDYAKNTKNVILQKYFKELMSKLAGLLG